MLLEITVIVVIEFVTIKLSKTVLLSIYTLCLKNCAKLLLPEHVSW